MFSFCVVSLCSIETRRPRQQRQLPRPQLLQLPQLTTYLDLISCCRSSSSSSSREAGWDGNELSRRRGRTRLNLSQFMNFELHRSTFPNQTKIHRSKDFEALKLWKYRSGNDEEENYNQKEATDLDDEVSTRPTLSQLPRFRTHRARRYWTT